MKGGYAIILHLVSISRSIRSVSRKGETNEQLYINRWNGSHYTSRPTGSFYHYRDFVSVSRFSTGMTWDPDGYGGKIMEMKAVDCQQFIHISEG